MSGSASPRRWNPWGDRNFRIFAAGNLVNNIGESAYLVALPLLVYQITGSLAAMAILMAATPVALLLGPVLGAIVDRHGSRVLVVPGLLIQFTAAISLNLLVLVDDPPTWPLFVFGYLVQLGAVCYQAGWMAGIASQFPLDSVRARGSLGTLFWLAQVIGPLIVAIVLPLQGFGALLWFNVVTFLAPIAVWIGGVRPPRRFVDDRGTRGIPRLASDLREGARAAFRNRPLMAALLARLPLLFVGMTGTISLALFLLRDQWNVAPEHVSLLLVVARIGAAIGALAISQWKDFDPRPVMLIYALGSMACLAAMAVPLLGVFAVGFFGIFIAHAGCSVAADMMIFKYMSSDQVGRAAGFIDLIEGAPILASPLLVPIIFEAFGQTVLFGAFATIALLAGFWLLARWRRWDEWEEQSRAEPVPSSGRQAAQGRRNQRSSPSTVIR